MNTTKQHCLSFYNDQGILTLNAKQFDTGRIFVFDIMDHDEPFNLTGCSASLHIQKADGTQFQGEDCCIIDTTKITINPALGNGAQILAADGVNVCELVLKDSEGLTLTTWDFHINVLKRVHNGENLRSSDAYDILDKIDRDEKIRKENESARIEAEQTRKTSESTRQTNETLRINAEEARKTAEAKRQEDTAKAIADAEKATKECIALNHEAESWAHGGTGIRPEEDTDNSKYWCQQSKDYADSWKGSLLPKGILNFAQLPTSGMTAGHLYHINDAFVTDGRFKEGAGYSYPAGTNVYWTQDGRWDCLSGVLTKVLSQAEYNALSESQKKNGTVYYIEDADNSVGEATATEKGLVKVDAALSTTSANPVQNKIVTTGLNDLTATLTAAVGNKVDKVSGKGLSANDYTTAEKNKLSGIAAGAEVNVQADWNVTDSGSDAFIKNKPAIPSVGNGTLTIQRNGTNIQTFTANQSTNKTVNITVPTKTSELTNDSGFVTAGSLTTGVSGVKGNAESNYRTGNVNLTAANIGALAADGKAKSASSADKLGSLNVGNSRRPMYLNKGTPYAGFEMLSIYREGFSTDRLNMHYFLFRGEGWGHNYTYQQFISFRPLHAGGAITLPYSVADSGSVEPVVFATLIPGSIIKNQGISVYLQNNYTLAYQIYSNDGYPPVYNEDKSRINVMIMWEVD